MIIIKKYSNRRLYDSQKKAYINLDDLGRLIRSGHDVQVKDAKSGEDLTQATLAQLILEGRGASKLLPVPLLLELVRMEEDALAEFFSTYVTWALEVYGQAKRGFAAAATINPLLSLPMEATKAMAKLFGWGGDGPAAAPQPVAVLQPLEDPPPEEEAEGEAEDDDDESGDLETLRKELDDLKKKLDRLM